MLGLPFQVPGQSILEELPRGKNHKLPKGPPLGAELTYSGVALSDPKCRKLVEQTAIATETIDRSSGFGGGFQFSLGYFGFF